VNHITIQSDIGQALAIMGSCGGRRRFAGIKTRAGRSRAKSEPITAAACGGYGAMCTAADVLLLNQIAAMEDAVIPCNLLTYMVAGRSFVAAVSENSEAARVIRCAKCGVLVPAEALSTALLAPKNDPGLRRVLEAYDEFFLTVLCTTGLSPAVEEAPET
jgi:hypothetical protein